MQRARALLFAVAVVATEYGISYLVDDYVESRYAKREAPARR